MLQVDRVKAGSADASVKRGLWLLDTAQVDFVGMCLSVWTSCLLNNLSNDDSQAG